MFLIDVPPQPDWFEHAPSIAMFLWFLFVSVITGGIALIIWLARQWMTALKSWITSFTENTIDTFKDMKGEMKEHKCSTDEHFEKIEGSLAKHGERITRVETAFDMKAWEKQRNGNSRQHG